MAWIELPDDLAHIFVFGSNVMGVHGAGAAELAHRRYGARMGVGEGLTGRCYALPTVGANYKRMSLDEVRLHVAHFLVVAFRQASHTFHLTPVGCGLAGFTPEDIAPMFRDAPPNVILPTEFLEVLA
jgi:Na+-driven multidrug efflux pump